MRIGIIDCGTNTFNLLVGDLDEDWNKVFSTKIPVMLGHGLNEDGIKPTRYARGIDALRSLKEIATNFGCEKIEAIGTSALRESPNGPEFAQDSKDLAGIDIQIISGMQEAELIYKGVADLRQSKGVIDLIIDIGGGSVEFIICGDDGVLWSQSVRLGVASIRQTVRPKDPLTDEDKAALLEMMDEHLGELFTECDKLKPQRLIGSSGSFDTFTAMLIPAMEQDPHFNPLDIVQFKELHQKLVISSKAERLVMPGMLPMRADSIALASTLVDYVLEKTKIDLLFQSAFALKEGVISSIKANDWNDS
jgi:exopolyphosphatase/guanosine-5'-triphosphate,3'-diphosphate pyrophosphatase